MIEAVKGLEIELREDPIVKGAKVKIKISWIDKEKKRFEVNLHPIYAVPYTAFKHILSLIEGIATVYAIVPIGPTISILCEYKVKE